jgi:hypothetical protein
LFRAKASRIVSSYRGAENPTDRQTVQGVGGVIGSANSLNTAVPGPSPALLTAHLSSRTTHQPGLGSRAEEGQPLEGPAQGRLRGQAQPALQDG